MPPPPGTIKHLVVLMLENRSFDHMLGFMKSAAYPIDGLNGDESNLDADGVAITVSKDADFSGDYQVDPGHHFPDVNTQIFGNLDGTGDPTMTGFVKAYAQMGGSNTKQSHNIMKCFSAGPVPDCKIPVLVTLAEQYAVCDRWFSSVPGPTLPNRSYAHAATSMGRLDMNPIWFEESKTIYELLAESGVTSKIFFHDATVAMTFKNFLKNQKFFGTFDDFLDACDNDKLPAYSFIEPRYNNDDTNHLAANDQHPDHDMAEGETLIHDVYQAISNNKKNKALWQNTVLLVVYDEHGGLYDHVVPPATVNPDNKNSTNPPFDFRRLGLRVPAIVISAWVPPGTIDHTQYDHASIAATARKLFLGAGIKPLTARDEIANPFDLNLTLDVARTGQIDFNAPHKVAAMARAADPAGVNARIAQNAVMPLSDLQKTMLGTAHFVDQHGLPQDQRSDINHDAIKTEQDAADFHNDVNSSFLAPQTGKATG